ncbi:MAG: IS1 family transposase, partial [Anaerolineae bacterium]|nr:IS1 family transposase [Anaerolineae bacterium]
QSVINWVNAYASGLPEAPTPEEVDTVEMDELYTFIGEKKTGST